MIIKARQTLALDGAFGKKDDPHEVLSYRSGDEWHVVKRGPRYSNAYTVVEFDAEGLQWLLAHEQKAE